MQRLCLSNEVCTLFLITSSALLFQEPLSPIRHCPKDHHLDSHFQVSKFGPVPVVGDLHILESKYIVL